MRHKSPRSALAMLVALPILLAGLVLAAGQPADTPEAAVRSSLRVQWSRSEGRPGIEGYVYNDSDYRIGLVRLRIAMRRDQGEASDATLAWVYGNVPARGRSYFNARLEPKREVAEVTVESFKLMAREDQAP